MGRQVTFTDLEWEFLQQKIKEGLINLSVFPFTQSLPGMPATIEEITQDNLGECILARLDAATIVPEPDFPTTTATGNPLPTGPEEVGFVEGQSPPPRYY